MSQEDFTLEAANNNNGGKSEAPRCAGVCPLAQIPAQVWTSLFHKPFRKRHPIIFGLTVVFVVFLLFSFVGWLFADDEDKVDKEGALALVSIKGAIMDVGPTLEWIRKLENNSGVKGILLRVDSPGGGAAASQEVYAALARVSRKIPIVVSMGSMGASGGLMVSMAGERIYANPSTITGSIGVRMDIPQFQGLMGKIGVGQETLVTAPFKDAASYMHPLTPEDRAYLEHVLKDMHNQFVEIVAKGRHMPLEKAEGLASGKIFTGQEAMGLGLVDEMGGEDEALAWLAKKTGISAHKKLLKRPSDRTRLMDLLFGAARIFGLDIDTVELRPERWTQPAFLYQF